MSIQNWEWLSWWVLTYVYVNKKWCVVVYYQIIIDFEYSILTPYKLRSKNYYEQCV
jgi:hypothetical protein